LRVFVRPNLKTKWLLTGRRNNCTL
jgi:hypothetical protein